MGKSAFNLVVVNFPSASSSYCCQAFTEKTVPSKSKGNIFRLSFDSMVCYNMICLSIEFEIFAWPNPHIIHKNVHTVTVLPDIFFESTKIRTQSWTETLTNSSKSLSIVIFPILKDVHAGLMFELPLTRLLNLMRRISPFAKLIRIKK